MSGRPSDTGQRCSRTSRGCPCPRCRKRPDSPYPRALAFEAEILPLIGGTGNRSHGPPWATGWKWRRASTGRASQAFLSDPEVRVDLCRFLVRGITHLSATAPTAARPHGGPLGDDDYDRVRGPGPRTSPRRCTRPPAAASTCPRPSSTRYSPVILMAAGAPRRDPRPCVDRASVARRLLSSPR